jgi:hypothetical protein
LQQLPGSEISSRNRTFSVTRGLEGLITNSILCIFYKKDLNMITGHTFTMTITPLELKNLIREVINEKSNNDINDRTDTRLYTRYEAIEMLKISLSTLDTYRKKGAITCSRLGTRVLFTQDDIDKALNKNRNYQNQ